MIPQLGDQIRDHSLANVFVGSSVFSTQVVPETQALLDALAADEVKRKIRTRNRALAHRSLQCFGIVAVDLPDEVEELRQQFDVSLTRETQFRKRFVVTTVSEIQIAEIPVWISVSRSERNRAFERELCLCRIADLFLRGAERHPEAIVVGREADCCFVFGDSGDLLIERQRFL